MSHNIGYKYNPNSLSRGHEDYRITTQPGAYVPAFQSIISQQNSTHDINKSISPASAASMYQQSTGAILGLTSQHHQPGMSGLSPTGAMVQGQQQINRAHLANMATFQPRTNPSHISSMPRTHMTNIVSHGGPQVSQAFQPMQNVMISHGHPAQLYQHFPIQMPVYQQRAMQYPLQQCAPQMYTPPYYSSTPTTPNPAYYHVSQCPPQVNNYPP